MKTFSLYLALLFAPLLAFPAGAQNRVGFLGGLSLANIVENPAPDGSGFTQRSGFGIGTFFERSLGETVAIRLESSYMQKGGGFTTSLYDEYYDVEIDVDAVLKLAYVETATMLSISPGRGTTRPYFMVGPAISYLVSARVSGTASAGGYTEIGGVDVIEMMNEIDFGFTFGAGIRFNYVFLEARYALGLSDITSDVEFEDLNRGLQFMAGISAPIGH